VEEDSENVLVIFYLGLDRKRFVPAEKANLCKSKASNYHLLIMMNQYF
jgi:hypothetical protein